MSDAKGSDRTCEFCGKSIPADGGIESGDLVFCCENCLWNHRADNETTESIFLAMEIDHQQEPEEEPDEDDDLP